MSRSRRGIFELLPHPPENSGGNVLANCLPVDVEHPDDPAAHPDEVDHARSAALALSTGCPAELADSTRPGNHDPGLRVSDQDHLKCGVLVIVEIPLDELREQRSLDDIVNRSSLRQRRSHVECFVATRGGGVTNFVEVHSCVPRGRVRGLLSRRGASIRMARGDCPEPFVSFAPGCSRSQFKSCCRSPATAAGRRRGGPSARCRRAACAACDRTPRRGSRARRRRRRPTLPAGRMPP